MNTQSLNKEKNTCNQKILKSFKFGHDLIIPFKKQMFRCEKRLGEVSDSTYIM